MSDVNANININIDSSQAIAELKSLQRQISLFYTSINKGSATAAAAAQNMQRNLINSINATGDFEARIRTINTASESFTTALEKNKLTMGEYFRYAGGASKTFSRLFRSEMETVQKTAIDRVKTLQTQYIKLGRDAQGAMKAIAVRPVALDMENYATKTMIAAQRQQIFNQLLKQGSTNLLNFGKNTQWAGRQLMVGFTVPLMYLGTVAGKTFMEMEQAAIKFRRVYGDMLTPSSETEKVLQDLQQLASEFTKYGVAVVDTMEMAAKAAAMGKKGAELTAQVAEATRLAVLGAVEQEEALQTTISLTNAFGVAADDLAQSINFLNAVENQTVVAIEDLTIAIPKAGPVVKQLGGDVRDLAFFLTAMKEGGINASEGANALKSGLASLINPTDKASQFLGKLGINITDIVERNKGQLRNTVVEFAMALDQLDPLNRARAIEQLFGKFQFARLSTLFQNVIKDGSQAAQVLDLAGKSIEELAILSERELGAIEDSTTAKFQSAVEQLKKSLVPLGEQFIKIATPIAEFFTKILDKFNSLEDGTKSTIAKVVAIVGGLGPVALMAFGLIANGIANVIKLGLTLRQGYQRLSGASGDLAKSTQYATMEQLEAASVAASLDQAHARLTQRFTAETQALNNLRDAYQRASVAAQNFATANPGAMLPPKPGRPPIRRALGGTVPGTGNQDTVPAMLTPGEYVINKKATQNNLPLLRAINESGDVQKFALGGMVARMAGRRQPLKQIMSSQEKKELDLLRKELTEGDWQAAKANMTFQQRKLLRNEIQPTQHTTFMYRGTRLPKDILAGIRPGSLFAAGGGLQSFSQNESTGKLFASQHMVGLKNIQGGDYRLTPTIKTSLMSPLRGRTQRPRTVRQARKWARKEYVKELGLWQMRSQGARRRKAELQAELSRVLGSRPEDLVPTDKRQSLMKEQLGYDIKTQNMRNLKSESGKFNLKQLREMSPGREPLTLRQYGENIKKQMIKDISEKIRLVGPLNEQGMLKGHQTMMDTLRKNVMFYDKFTPTLLKVLVRGGTKGINLGAGRALANRNVGGPSIYRDEDEMLFNSPFYRALSAPIMTGQVAQITAEMVGVKRFAKGGMVSNSESKKILARGLVQGFLNGNQVSDKKPFPVTVGKTQYGVARQQTAYETQQLIDHLIKYKFKTEQEIIKSLDALGRRRGGKGRPLNVSEIQNQMSLQSHMLPPGMKITRSNSAPIPLVKIKEKLFKDNPIFKQEEEHLKRLFGNRVTDSVLQAQIAHLNPAMARDSQGMKAWAANNLMADTGLINNYMNGISINSAGQGGSQLLRSLIFDTSDKELLRLLRLTGADPLTIRETLARLYEGFHPSSKTMANTLLRFVEFRDSSDAQTYRILKNLPKSPGGTSTGDMVAASLRFRLQNRFYDKENLPLIGPKANKRYLGQKYRGTRQLSPEASEVRRFISAKRAEYQFMRSLISKGVPAKEASALAQQSDLRGLMYRGRLPLVVRRNKGGSIPGVGNTDKVPALLTPGEYVINKEATANNRALLEQINSQGKVQKFNKGGMAEVQRFARGGDVKSSGWTIFGGKSGSDVLDGVGKEANQLKNSLSGAKQRVLDFSGKVSGAGMAAFFATSALSMAGGTVGDMANSLMPVIGGAQALAMALPLLMNPWGLAIAAIGALAFGIWKFNDDINKAREEGINLAKAMSSTSDKLQQMSMITGKVGASEIQARKQETFLAGESAVSRKYGETFLGSESGKQILADIDKMVQEGFSNQKIANAIATQLGVAITQGIVTTDQARSIAAAIGEELGSYVIPLEISANITRIFGPDGSDLINGRGISIAISEQSMQNVRQAFATVTQSVSGPMDAYAKTLEQTTAISPSLRQDPRYQQGQEVMANAIARSSQNNKLMSAALELGLQQLSVNRGLVDAINEQYDKKVAIAKTDKEIADLEKRRQEDLDNLNKKNQEQVDYILQQKKILKTFDIFDTVAQSQLKTMYKGPQLALAEGAAQELSKLTEGDIKSRIEVEFYSGNLDPTSLLTILSNEQLQSAYVLTLKQRGSKEATEAVKLLTNAGLVGDEARVVFDLIIDAKTNEEWQANKEALLQITNFKQKYGITIDVTAENLSAVAQGVMDLKDLPDTISKKMLFNTLKNEKLDPRVEESIRFVYDNWKELLGEADTTKKTFIFDAIATKGSKSVVDAYVASTGVVSPTAIDRLASNEEQARIDRLRQQVQKTEQTVSDTTTKTGPGGGPSKTTTFINDLLAQLKLLRNASINAAGGMTELMRVLGKGKDIKIFKGISQQLTAKGFTQDFINSIAGMEAKVRKEFIKIKDGVVTVTKEGRALNKAFREISLGQVVADAKSIVRDTQNRTVALRKLTAAGLDAKSSYELLENAAIAAEIANKKFSDKEIKRLVKALKDAKKAMEAYQLQTQEGIINAAQSGVSVANEAFDLYNQMAEFLSPEQLSNVSLPVADEANRQILLDMQESYDKIDGLTDSINENNLKALDIQQEISAIQSQINAKQQQLTELQRQIEIQFDRPIEALQEQIQDLQREIELQFTRPIEDLQETINDMERAIELNFDRPIQTLQEESTRLSNDLALIDNATEKINEKYDKQEEALNKIAEVNNEIIAQEKTRINLADALTQGDIAAAAQAAQDMRAQAAQYAQGQQSGLLTAARQAEIDALRSASGMTRDQIEQRLFDINQEVYKLEQARLVEQQKILAIQDQIYNLQEQQEAKVRQIRDLEDKIYQLEQDRKPLLDQIKAIQDAIFELENGRLLTLQNELDQINLQNELLNYRKTLEEESLRKLNEQLTVAGLTNEQWMEQNALLAAAKLNSEEFYQALMLALRAIEQIVANWSTLGALGDINVPTTGGGGTGAVAMAMGGKVKYMNMGGKIAYMANGGMKPRGTDTVPAMLTPGEFVVRKKVVDKLGTGFFEDLNSGKLNGPRFRVPSPYNPRPFDDINVKKEVEKTNTVYNSYSINVNAGNGNANDIAKAVIKQIRDIDNQRIRGNRI